MGSKYEYCARGIAFGILAILLEITFFVLYCVLVNYGNFSYPQFLFPFFNNSNFTNSTCCSPFCNIDQNTGMVLLGLGFFFTMIRCTSFSAVGYILFLFAIIIQWAGLVIPWLFQAALDFYEPQYIYMNSTILCDVIYGAFALAIAYGALVGVASRIQALIMVIFGVVLYAVNRLVVIHYLYVSDVGGSITIYLFGGLFGLSVLFAILVKQKNWCCIYKCDREGTYYQYLFAFLGALLLITFWPTFIAKSLPDQSDLQERALVNSYYSITSAIIIAYAVSSFVTRCCKLTILHVISGSIAGAVIVGAVAPLITQVWGAILLGAFAGFSVVIFLRYMPCIRFCRPDMFGIFWTFAFSGFVGGVASAIMAAIVFDTDDQVLTLSELILIYPAIVYGNLGVGSPRTASEQGGYQMLGVTVTLGIAIAGGLLVGILIRWIGPLEDEEYFDDTTEWRVCCCPCPDKRCEKAVTPCERVIIPPI
ncbi:hypothetical protein HZS_1306 [Henneguya salminicola]|nr:hypothetical protein HZS_1306 [Henneguya salminicola]